MFRQNSDLRNGTRNSYLNTITTKGGTEDSVSGYDEEKRTERDDLKNPYWLDDFFPDRPELGGGPIDFLPGTEIVFWNELIKKYLTPLEMNKKQKEEQLKALKAETIGLIRQTATFGNSPEIWGEMNTAHLN